MAVRTAIPDIAALCRKAEREAYRALHARSRLGKADHFLNFCITAHSLRDYYLEFADVSPGPQRGPYHAQWDRDTMNVAVKEIANLAKHFVLRESRSKVSPKTRRLAHTPSTVGDLFVRPDKNIEIIPRPARNIFVTTEDGVTHELWTFQVDVLEYWRDYLRTNGVRVRRESLKNLLDLPAGA